LIFAVTEQATTTLAIALRFDAKKLLGAPQPLLIFGSGSIGRKRNQCESMMCMRSSAVHRV
jgi:hypothetical protein